MYMYVRQLSHAIVEIVEASFHECSVLLGSDKPGPNDDMHLNERTANIPFIHMPITKY